MRLIALAFLAGTAAVQQMPALPATSLSLALAGGGTLLGALAVCRLARESRARHLLSFVAALAAAFGWAAWRADLRLAESLPPALEGRDIEIVGVVAEMPQRFARGERFAFDVERVGDVAVAGAAARLPSSVMLSWYAPERGEAAAAANVRPGERWRFTVRLKRPQGNANPFAFDYEAWLLERNIRATGYVRSDTPPQRLQEFVARPAYVVERARDEVRERFVATLSGQPYAGVLIALAVGDQRAIDGEFWQVFSRTGTTHLMSISGLHVTMVAALVGALAGFCWRRSPRLMARIPAQRVAILAGWVAAMLYALLSGFSVPAQRTAYMLSVAAVAILVDRRASISTTLSLALLLVLAIDPWAVLAPGFWLSFGAVGLLFYVACGRNPAAGGWRATVAGWSAAQWAVGVGTLPLLLLFFQQFSLVSPLANALAIPAISLVVTPLALLAIVAPLPLLLDIAHGLLSGVMAVLTWMSEFPVYQQPAPPPWAVGLALAGVVWLLLPRGVPARWLGLLLFVPALSFVPSRPPAGEAELVFLDVGQGLAVLVRTATKTLLYDTGPLYSAESDAGQRIVLPYLRALGVDRLDALIVTHSDTDHSGGAASILAALPVGRVLSSLPELPGEACRRGLAWQWDGVDFALLHPAQTHAAPGVKPNHRSCVLRIVAGGRAALFTADIEAADERELIAADAAALRADVLLAPHHGSRSSSTPAFVAAVAARDVIHTVGYRNRFGHPHRDVLARYGDARQWRSDRDGAIRVRLGEQIAISAYRDERPRYWHGNRRVLDSPGRSQAGTQSAAETGGAQ